MEKPSLPTMICSLGQLHSVGLKSLGYGFPAGVGRKDPPFLEPVPLKPANDAIWSTGAISPSYFSDLATFVSGCPALTPFSCCGGIFLSFFFPCCIDFFSTRQFWPAVLKPRLHFDPLRLRRKECKIGSSYAVSAPWPLYEH